MKNTILSHTETGNVTKTIMNKFIFIFVLGFFSLGALANPTLASKQQIGMFKNSKTCVVFEDGISFYNAFIKDAVQKYWKSTSYEFIDQREFEKRRSDSKYSFLVLMDGVYDKDPGGVSYNYLSLVLGDASNILTKMPEICSIPISYSGDKDVDYEYVIPSIVKFMQIHERNLEKDKNRLLISMKGLRFYNNSNDFSSKVLLLNKDKMAPNADTPEKIRNVYSYYVKLLTTAEIKEEIVANPANALLEFHVGPAENSGSGKCFEMIFDVEGKLYYYNYRKITNENPDGFNLKDFSHLR